MHVRLLPWKPRWRDVDSADPGALDLGGDDLGIGLVIALVVFAFPILIVLLVFSLEVLALLLVLPFLLSGQLLGLLPWVLVTRTTTGERRAIEVRGTRSMLAARRYYRSLRV